MIPPRVALIGDRARAEALRGFALSQVRILHNQMSFRDLKQDVRMISLDNGSYVRVESNWGFDRVEIFVPVAVPVPVEEIEEVELEYEVVEPEEEEPDLPSRPPPSPLEPEPERTPGEAGRSSWHFWLGGLLLPNWGPYGIWDPPARVVIRYPGSESAYYAWIYHSFEDSHPGLNYEFYGLSPQGHFKVAPELVGSHRGAGFTVYT